MKKLTSVILLLVLSLTAVEVMAAPVDARQLLQRVSNNLRSAVAVEASFAVTEPQRSSGTMTLSRDRFVINSEMLSTWYDGHTQWTYSPANNEVTVLLPSPEELYEINPLLIMGSLSTSYYVAVESSDASSATLKLTAKQQGASVRECLLKVNTVTDMPQSLTMTMADGNRVTIYITAIKKLTTVSDSTFRFNQSAFPGVDVIDLR